MRFASRIATISGVIGLTLALSAQPAPVTSVTPDKVASIEGIVLNAVSKEPIRRAEVRLSKAGGAAGVSAGPIVFGAGADETSVTDADGKFVFSGIAPGKYRLMAQKSGFVNAYFRFGGNPARSRGASFLASEIEAKPGEKFTGARIELMPQGIISGRVVDDEGEPLPNVMVQALRFAYFQGRKRPLGVGGAPTNDRGEFRLHNLPPDRYILSIQSPMNAPPTVAKDRMANVRTFYPGVADLAEASKIEVGPGAEVGGIQLRFVKGRVSSVKGRVLDESGKPQRSFFLNLQSADGPPGPPAGFANGRNEQGEFQLSGIPAGRYVLVVGVPGTPGISHRQKIEVGPEDIEGVDIRLTAPAPMNVQVTAPESVKADFTKANISLVSPDMTWMSVGERTPDETGRLKIQNVLPGMVRAQVMIGDPSLYVESVFYGDREVTGKEFEISLPPADLRVVLNSGATTVTGTALRENEPVVGALALLLAAGDRKGDRQRTRFASSGERGAITFPGVAPGDYLAFAFLDGDPGVWEDPEVLAAMESKGVKVSVTRNGSPNVTLPVVNLPELP